MISYDTLSERNIWSSNTRQTGTREQGEAIERLYGWADVAYACHRNGHSHSGTCFAYASPGTVHTTDNLSMTALASKFSGNTKRVKHFLVRINYMIEQVANQVVHLEYIMNINPADACTKALARPAHEKLRPLLLGAA